MSYQQYDSVRPNQTYQSIREGQRQAYNAQYRAAPDMYRPSTKEQYRYQSQESQYKRKSYPNNQKKTELKTKIRQIIQLCKDENAAVSKDIAGVAQTQKGILNQLQQLDYDTSVAPPQVHYSHSPINSATSPNYTPVRKHSDDVQNPGKNLQKDIKALLEKNSQIKMSEEAMLLIDQIQRRALAEIQKLREEKLGIINQLNNQIRMHNAEKKKNMELERELQYYRKGGQAGGGDDGRYVQELKARVNYLQNMLQQMQQQESIKDIPDFKILFAQGEAIRQQTLRLVRMKEAKGYSDDEQKRRLRGQVEALQRKLEHYQHERVQRVSKPSYEVINQQYSPIAASHKRKDSNRNSANEYESLVMQMRKITSN